MVFWSSFFKIVTLKLVLLLDMVMVFIVFFENKGFERYYYVMIKNMKFGLGYLDKILVLRFLKCFCFIMLFY